jgi:hypothetical protein
MARKGRPSSRSGKREKNGRLKRNSYAEPSYDKGSEWVQAMRERFGTYYNTPLGRAYAAGLLGDLNTEAELALNRYQAGRRFASLYTKIIGSDVYRCALDRTPRGAANDIEDSEALERDKAEQDWLMNAMDKVDRSGTRPWLDQLLSRLNTDAGPYWLDALLAGGKHPADTRVLNAALGALDILAPVPQRSRILVVHS